MTNHKDSTANKSRIALGVNIDHIATLRNARGGSEPSLTRAAMAAIDGGADYITVHLREDRRHILDKDIPDLLETINKPINLEMAATREMRDIALSHRPGQVCIVPERRQELTTEGGLDVVHSAMVLEVTKALKSSNIPVSLFIDPTPRQIEAAASVGADAVELHTGAYANATTDTARAEMLLSLQEAAKMVIDCGLSCHAGHGLNLKNITSVAAILAISELHVGHFLVGEAIFSGFTTVTQKMVQVIHDARTEAIEHTL